MFPGYHGAPGPGAAENNDRNGRSDLRRRAEMGRNREAVDSGADFWKMKTQWKEYLAFQEYYEFVDNEFEKKIKYMTEKDINHYLDLFFKELAMSQVLSSTKRL